MATLDKVKERISEIAGRRKNTTVDEIDWVVRQLRENGYRVRDSKRTKGGHSVLYGIGSVRFAICVHNPGSKQVKSCYVDEFLEKMMELGLYD